MPVIQEKNSTMSLFNSFKKSDEERSSDDESFHLLLETDDEKDDSINSSTPQNGDTPKDEATSEKSTKETESDLKNGPLIVPENSTSKNNNSDNCDEINSVSTENGITSSSTEENGVELSKNDSDAKEDDSDKENVSEKESNQDELLNKPNINLTEINILKKADDESCTSEPSKIDAIDEVTNETNSESSEEQINDDTQQLPINEISDNAKVNCDTSVTNEEIADQDEKKSIGDKIIEPVSNETKIEVDVSLEGSAKNEEDNSEQTVESKIHSNEDVKEDKKENEECENKTEQIENEMEQCGSPAGSPHAEEDLMDISIIRDVDEDNAKYLQGSEKSSSDNEDQEDTDIRDEIQMDIEESCVQGDKTENVSCEISDLVKDNIELNENSEKNIVSDILEDNESNDSDKTIIINTKESTKSAEESITVEENKSNKRVLPEDDENSNDSTKRMKLTPSDISQIIENEIQKDVLILKTFVDYMKNKKLYNKISRSDLEQFLLEKCCEVIVYKTTPGSIRQRQIQQDEIIEQLKTQVAQLSKQCTDLQIVNKKLISEVKALITTRGKSELIPLKITRSVGLQVKSSIDPFKKKTTIITNPPPKQQYTNKIRQVKPIGPRPVLPKPGAVNNQSANAPLLTQALQTRNKVPLPSTYQKRTSPAVTPKPPDTNKNKVNNNVIDLTEEDDKTKSPAKNSLPVTYKTVPLKAVVSAANFNKSLGQNKTVMKNGSITLPASVMTTGGTTPQLMYVVQPTGNLPPGATQKAVIVNFQPSNNLISSPIQSNTLSLLPKTSSPKPLVVRQLKHPAPLPAPPAIKLTDPNAKPMPPKPHLTIRKTDHGIVLQWKMPYNLDIYESIASYQLYAYQETSGQPSTDMWRKVGDVKALALPMACTLTQFADKNKYYFAVRSVDVHKRIGPFSDPEEISI